MYILKIKGTDKIPDFVQIRDQDMTLRAYFRMDQQESGIRKNNLEKWKKEIISTLEKIPFGKLKKLDIQL
ncbi:MAG TPA: fructose-6-phosphate aldolase [Flavobacteriales bacterium]|nr:fructose-6-phosphate aldolase [Flavobacteriales bacterium]